MPHPLQHQMMPSAVAAAATPYGMGGLPDAAARAQQVVANIRQILSPLPELVGVGSPVEGLRTAVRHVTQQEIHPAAASEMRCGSLYEARAGLLGGLGVLGWVGVPHGVGLGGSVCCSPQTFASPPTTVTNHHLLLPCCSALTHASRAHQREREHPPTPLKLVWRDRVLTSTDSIWQDEDPVTDPFAAAGPGAGY